MRVNIIIEEAEYGKFSDIKLCYNDNGLERKGTLTFSIYERVFDFKSDLESVKFDFLLISAIVYGVDNLLSRAVHSNDGWHRDIEVIFPVKNIDQWIGKEMRLMQILDFLTGDTWTVSFREIEDVTLFYPRDNRRRIPFYDKESVAAVSLFSGGLDSLIGIIDKLEELEAGQKILLASHFDSKSPGPNGDQRKLLEELQVQYPGQIYWIQSKLLLSRFDESGNKITVENNYRSRSLFFIGLGCFLSTIDELIIPENGTISINYPLTPSRVSSLSTRTTHPYVLKNTQLLLSELGLNMNITNPYKHQTKGDMFTNCSNQTFLQRIYAKSISCGKRGRRQFHYDNPEAVHCGRCMPCIYRRAALHKAELDNENHYGNFITRVSSLGRNDLPALFNYLKKDISLEKMKRDILVNGNIDINELAQYAEMVLRSKDEVRQLFIDKGSDFVRSELGNQNAN